MPRHVPKTSQRQPAEQRLIEAALDLIEKNGGCRGVNLRQIAAQAKCAHTNAYNYFDSLEDLLWAALDRSLERLIDYTDKRLQSEAGAKDPLRTFMEAQIDFTLEHPALYRLFWLEPLAGPPRHQALERVDWMRQSWKRFITGSAEKTSTPDDHEWPAPVIHGYFHGELCKLVGREAFMPKNKDTRDRIVRTTLRLIKEICPPKTRKAAGRSSRR